MAQDLTELLIKAGFADIRTSRNYSTLIKSDYPLTFFKEGKYNGNPWPSVKVVTLVSKADEESIKLYHLSGKEVTRAAKGESVVLSERKSVENVNRILFYLQTLSDRAA